MTDIFEVLRRSENGPYAKENDFDMKLFKTTSRLVKEHGIKFDKDIVVTADDKMADGLFQAGLALATEMGMLSTDTSRIIEFSEQELRRALWHAPQEMVLGQGRDARTLRARRFD